MKGPRQLWYHTCPGVSSNGDRELVARFQGDGDAFSMPGQSHSRLVNRVALRLLGSKEAQDASQEVWVRVWNG